MGEYKGKTGQKYFMDRQWVVAWQYHGRTIGLIMLSFFPILRALCLSSWLIDTIFRVCSFNFLLILPLLWRQTFRDFILQSLAVTEMQNDAFY